MQARKLYWNEVQVGETLPPLVKEPLTRVQLVKYAGASGDFNPMHVDEVYAKEAGMPGVFGHGMLLMGFLGQLVEGWAGVNGKVRSVGARFVKIVWPGDVITCCGRVLRLGHDQGRYTVSLDLWAENQKGELVVKGSAEVQLFHSPDDEARQARGDRALVISSKPPPALEERIGAPMEPVRTVARRPSRRRTAAAKKAKATGRASSATTRRATATKAKRAKPPAKKKAAAKKVTKAAKAAKPAKASKTAKPAKKATRVAAKKTTGRAKAAAGKVARKKPAAAKKKAVPRKASKKPVKKVGKKPARRR